MRDLTGRLARKRSNYVPNGSKWAQNNNKLSTSTVGCTNRLFARAQANQTRLCLSSHQSQRDNQWLELLVNQIAGGSESECKWPNRCSARTFYFDPIQELWMPLNNGNYEIFIPKVVIVSLRSATFRPTTTRAVGIWQITRRGKLKAKMDDG